MENDTITATNDEPKLLLVPLVCNDARYRAGRKLMERGQVQLGAVNIFSLLLDRVNEEFGESSIETAAVGYEYGYALFLDSTRQSSSMETGVMVDGVDHHRKKEDVDEEAKVEIALEHMVIACEILYKYTNGENETTQTTQHNHQVQHKDGDGNQSYIPWALEQLPRVLIGIGYVLSYQGKHPDALNSYLNSLPYRTNQLESKSSKSSKSKDKISIDQLTAHRLLVEVYVLIVEEILKCPADKDILIPDTNEVIVKKEERIAIAKDHYEKAREELQEV